MLKPLVESHLTLTTHARTWCGRLLLCLHIAYIHIKIHTYIHAYIHAYIHTYSAYSMGDCLQVDDAIWISQQILDKMEKGPPVSAEKLGKSQTLTSNNNIKLTCSLL